jgi:hypothetical protein
MHWPEAPEVVARTAAVLSLILLCALFGMLCSATASVLTHLRDKPTALQVLAELLACVVVTRGHL